ncbi:MAG: hypothetical protein JXB88_09275 [Spirochaetales bacterium]|nr:hypothetical protein [Spirochaetales bacterium]
MKIFCKIIILIAFSAFVPVLLLGDHLLVNIIKKDTLEADIKSGGEIDDYKVDELFAIYERVVEIDGVIRYTGYVDSVYLKSINRYKLVFGYIWSGEQRNIKEGYYLVRTYVSYKGESLN